MQPPGPSLRVDPVHAAAKPPERGGWQGFFLGLGGGGSLPSPASWGGAWRLFGMHFEVEKVRFALKKKTGVHCPGCSLAHPSRTTRGGGWAHPSSLRHWRPAWRLTTDSPGGDPKGEQTLDGSRSRGLGVAFSCSSFFFSFAGSARSFRETSSALAWPRAGRENRVGGGDPHWEMWGSPPCYHR